MKNTFVIDKVWRESREAEAVMCMLGSSVLRSNTTRTRIKETEQIRVLRNLKRHSETHAHTYANFHAIRSL